MLLLILTFYALFFDDYMQLASSKQADGIYDIVSFTAMGIFILELVLTSIIIKGYFNSYFFYLDLISSASILLDTGPIRVLINNAG